VGYLGGGDRSACREASGPADGAGGAARVARGTAGGGPGGGAAARRGLRAVDGATVPADRGALHEVVREAQGGRSGRWDGGALPSGDGWVGTGDGPWCPAGLPSPGTGPDDAVLHPVDCGPAVRQGTGRGDTPAAATAPVAAGGGGDPGQAGTGRGTDRSGATAAGAVRRRRATSGADGGVAPAGSGPGVPAGMVLGPPGAAAGGTRAGGLPGTGGALCGWRWSG
jgi:hypothetical protein